MERRGPFVVPAYACAGPGREPPETAKRLNLRTVVVIDPVRTVVVTDPVQALSLRPGRSSVVTDLLAPLELPRFFHQDLSPVQARAATGAFSHLPHTNILHAHNNTYVYSN